MLNLCALNSPTDKPSKIAYVGEACSFSVELLVLDWFDVDLTKQHELRGYEEEISGFEDIV